MPSHDLTLLAKELTEQETIWTGGIGLFALTSVNEREDLYSLEVFCLFLIIFCINLA